MRRATPDDGLSIGDRLQDNDPRMRKRTLTVVAITPEKVMAKDVGGRVFTYKRSRVFTDNRMRKSGISKLYHFS